MEKSIYDGQCKSLGLLLRQFSDLGGVAGMNIFDPGYSPFSSPKFRLFVATYALYCYMTFYSLAQVLGTGDFMLTAFWFVPLGYLVQTLTKIPVYFFGRSTLLDLCQQFHDIYARNMENVGRIRILERFLSYSATAMQAMMWLYYTAGVLVIVVPLTLSIVLGKPILPFGLYLPHLDPLTSPGFQLNYIALTYMMYLVNNGYVATESYFVMNIFLGMGHLDMLSEMVESLNGLLQTKNLKSNAKLETAIEDRIKEIIFEHVAHRRFSGIFERVFSLNSLVTVGSAAMMILVCLVVLVKKFWLLGLVLIVMALWQILFICVMGMAFETCSWKFSEKLYRMDWYLLSPKHRKYWCLLMTMAQRPNLNTLGGLHPSNLNTFVMVSRIGLWELKKCE